MLTPTTPDYCIQYTIGILAPYRRDTEAHRLKSVFFSHVAVNVLSRPEVNMNTILAALCFIGRISWGFQNHLDNDLEKPWDGEDLLLGALITANKVRVSLLCGATYVLTAVLYIVLER